MKKRILVLAIIVIGFLVVGLMALGGNPGVDYSKTNGLEMARRYFKQLEAKGMVNQYGHALVTEGISPIDYYAREKDEKNLFAVAIMVQYRPSSLDLTIKRWWNKLPPEPTVLVTNTYLVTGQNVEIIAEKDSKIEKPIVSKPVREQLRLSDALDYFTNPPPNDRIKLRSSFVIIQDRDTVRVYEVPAKGRVKFGLAKIIPYTLF